MSPWTLSPVSCFHNKSLRMWENQVMVIETRIVFLKIDQCLIHGVESLYVQCNLMVAVSRCAAARERCFSATRSAALCSSVANTPVCRCATAGPASPASCRFSRVSGRTSCPQTCQWCTAHKPLTGLGVCFLQRATAA